MDKQELIKQTHRLLANRPRSLELSDVADAIEVPHEWVRAFSRLKYAKNPKLSRVQKLYAYLTGQHCA